MNITDSRIDGGKVFDRGRHFLRGHRIYTEKPQGNHRCFLLYSVELILYF